MLTGALITLLITALWVGLLLLVYWGGELETRWLARALGLIGLALLVSGQYFGLFVAPPERDMGDVYRIMYVHVPAMEMAFMALTINFAYSVGFLFKRNWRFDSAAEASAEVGLLFGGYGIVLGSIWARPTWGVWWTWDPRLTTTAILIVLYAGYLALRRFVDDPERRAVWSAVAAIVAAVDLPIIWYSVKWWASMHQMQSSPDTIPDPAMKLALRWNLFADFFLLMAFVLYRYRIAKATRTSELAPPEPAREVAAA